MAGGPRVAPTPGSGGGGWALSPAGRETGAFSENDQSAVSGGVVFRFHFKLGTIFKETFEETRYKCKQSLDRPGRFVWEDECSCDGSTETSPRLFPPALPCPAQVLSPTLPPPAYGANPNPLAVFGDPFSVPFEGSPPVGWALTRLLPPPRLRRAQSLPRGLWPSWRRP